MPTPSPRPWEPDFMRLWQAGASQAAIAAALAARALLRRQRRKNR
jgi:hypothetical protein